MRPSDLVNDTGIAGKICTKCKQWKDAAEFGVRHNKHSSALRPQCKQCARDYAKEKRLQNPEEARRRDKESKERNAAKIKEYRKKVYAENREEILERGRKYDRDFPEKKKARRKAYYEANRERENAKSIEYARNNPDIVRAIVRRGYEKKKSTPSGILTLSMRRSLSRGLVGGARLNRNARNIVDFTIDELRAHLERQFLPGMTWDNYGRGKGKWSIDHIVPLAAHNYETPDDIDFKKAWALDNLQPLWNYDNSSKGAKLKGVFQPSLHLAVTDRANA